MQKILFLSLLIIVPALNHAQVGGLFNKVKNKVNQRVDTRIDQTIDKTLDQAEGKNNETEPDIAKNDRPVSAPGKAEETGRFSSRYDFIPGTEILYYDNFDQEAIAELPMSWNTNGTGEVVPSDEFPGKWLQVHTAFMYLTGNTKTLSENYTVEFDLILKLKNNGWMYPTFSFALFATGGDAGTDNKFLKEIKTHAALMATFHPAENNDSKILLESFSGGKPYFTSEPKAYGELDKYYGRPIHVACQIQKQRFRMWINQSKVFDVPRGIDTSNRMNQLCFKVGQTNYKEDQYSIYMSNIKVATGVTDTRHQLIDEGKFSTTGILFDVNSAVIRPESYGVIKELAGVLKENPSVHFRITGHTSSDGDDHANFELSRKRADAVKDLLVKDFGIQPEGLKTAGKGETQPVADNKTKEGKAANRRVEFVKLQKG